jgi:broad specificity phosphatase PhoE
MKLIYVHHGHRAKGNPPSQNDGLTEIGKQDTMLTAEILKDLKKYANPVAIYTSQFFRCTETAKNINTHLNLPIIVDNRLDEFRSVDGETWTDLLNRVIDCIKDAVGKHDNDDTIIFVTSGVNLSGFICFTYNLEPNEDIPFPMVPSCSPIGFDYDKNGNTAMPKYFK